MDAKTHQRRRGGFGLRRWLLVGVAILVIVLAGGYAIFALETNDAPPPARLPTAAAGGGSSGPIDGLWVVSPGAHDFVGYRVREKLGPLPAPDDAVGRTRMVRGTVRVRHRSITDARITGDLSTLRSDAPPRDGTLRHEGIETDRFPNATFVLAHPLALPGVTRGRVLRLRALGRLTLHGLTRTLPVALEARWNGDSIDVAGSTTFPLALFKIEIAQRLGLHISNRGTMEFELTLRRRANARPVEAPVPRSQGPGADGRSSTALPVNARELRRERTSRVRAALAVVAGRPDDVADAYVVNGDGSGVRALTRQPHDGAGANILSVARGPAGDLLVAREVSPPQSDPLPARLYRLDALTRKLTPLTPATTNADTPALSPDGRLIAYAHAAPQSDTWQLYVARADGSEAHPLPRVGASDDAPAFSPDAHTIAFTCFADTEDICLIDRDGQAARHLTAGSAYDSRPSWSPDGRRLVFARDGHIWSVRPDGSGLRPLTHGARVRDTAPTYSPDGRLIAFVRSDARPDRSFTGPGRAMLVRPDGSHLRRIAAAHLPPVRLVAWR